MQTWQTDQTADKGWRIAHLFCREHDVSHQLSALSNRPTIYGQLSDVCSFRYIYPIKVIPVKRLKLITAVET